MNEVKTNKKSSTASSVAKSTLAMSVATLSSRITGLIRTWMMAFALGNTMITSAYQVANTMPNAIYDFVAGGLMGAAFIPIFMLEKEKHSKKGSNEFACNILNLTIIVMGVLSVLACIFSYEVIATQTFTVGQDAAVTETSVLFFRIFAFQILFYGISGVMTAVLNGERIYFMPAFAPAINNVVVILSFAAYSIISAWDPFAALIILGFGTTLGVAVQAIMQIPSMIKSGFKWKPILGLKDPALIAAIKIAIPTFIYIVGTLVAFTCRNAFSLAINENGPATLIYAWTWYQLPYGIIAVSLSRTMFTEMSDSFAKDNNSKLRKQVNLGLSATILLIIPLAILMFVFAFPLMSLFRAGNFNSTDVGTVSEILKYWVLSLPFYSVLMYLYNVYASIRKFGTFTAVSTIAVALQCALYYIFCQISSIGLAGIPFADLIYYAVCCILLLLILQNRIGKFEILKLIWSGIRMIAASLIGAAFGFYLMSMIDLGSTSMLNGIFQLIICGTLSLIIIVVFSWTFRIPEVLKVFNVAKKKFKRR